LIGNFHSNQEMILVHVSSNSKKHFSSQEVDGRLPSVSVDGGDDSPTTTTAAAV
jgi:hypothetical protein